MPIKVECPYGGEPHVYPDDWKFGGANGLDPAADERFKSSHYQFIDSELGFSFMSGQFRCDDAALDYFTTVAERDPKVKWIAVKRPGSPKFEMMPYVYVVETDTVHPYNWKKD